MTKKYLCFVNKDHHNAQLELIHANKYSTDSSPKNEGAINFQNKYEMNDYFNKYCISEEQLKNNENNIFMSLFFLLLLIIMITIIYNMISKSTIGNSLKFGKTSVGRFSF